jgi:6-pyruvoyl-tetrahydropterin synthase
MFIFGFLYAKIVDKIKAHFKDQKLLKDMILQFEEILSNIKKGQAVFVSRVNHTVMLDTKLKDYNIVNVVYLMDKSIVCIFKENKCIYTSETIDKKLNENIISNIHEQYGKQIDDVVEVLGVTISREELESKLKDFESVNQFKWYAAPRNGGFTFSAAHRIYNRTKSKVIYMHKKTMYFIYRYVH